MSTIGLWCAVRQLYPQLQKIRSTGRSAAWCQKRTRSGGKIKRVRTATSFATRVSISAVAATDGRSVGLFENVKERFSRLQVSRLEPFGEAVVDRLEEYPRRS